MKILVALVFVFCFVCNVQAQVQKAKEANDYSFRASYFIGEISDNFEGLPPYGDSYYIQLDFHRQAREDEIWKNNYFFPETGFSVLYGNLGNDSILGSVFSIYPSWYINMYRTKRVGILLNLGIGFAYFNTPFSLIDNPTNILIGSHITNITELGASVRIKLIKQLHLSAGVSLIHFSNGHVKLPNVGINDRRIQFGLQYTPNQKSYERIKPEKGEKSAVKFNVRMSVGLHEAGSTIRPIGGKVYPIYGVAGFISKQQNYNDYYVGLNCLYYQSFYNFVKHEDVYIGDERSKSMVMSVFFGHEFLLNRFSFVQELAFKYYNPIYEDLKLYGPNDSKQKILAKKLVSFRLGFQYYILDKAVNQKHNLALGLFIKSNLVQADFVEFNLSYCF